MSRFFRVGHPAPFLEDSSSSESGGEDVPRGGAPGGGTRLRPEPHAGPVDGSPTPALKRRSCQSLQTKKSSDTRFPAGGGGTTSRNSSTKMPERVESAAAPQAKAKTSSGIPCLSSHSEYGPQELHPSVLGIRINCEEAHRRIWGLQQALRAGTMARVPEAVAKPIDNDLTACKTVLIKLIHGADYCQKAIRAAERDATIRAQRTALENSSTEKHNLLAGLVQDLEMQLAKERDVTKQLQKEINVLRHQVLKQEQDIRIQKAELHSLPAPERTSSASAQLTRTTSPWERNTPFRTPVRPYMRQTPMAQRTGPPLAMPTFHASGGSTYAGRSRAEAAQPLLSAAPESHRADPYSVSLGSTPFTWSVRAGDVIHAAQTPLATLSSAQTAEFRDKFDKLFTMVVNLCRNHGPAHPGQIGQNLPTSAPRLWEHMCQLFHLGPSEAGAPYVKDLAKDTNGLAYLGARLVTTYLVGSVFCMEAWKGYGEETDAGLESLQERLQQPSVYQTRQHRAMVDSMAAVVETITTANKWRQNRQVKINHHVARIKTAVGHLLANDSDSRRRIALQIWEIAEAAVELSASVYRSRLSFDYLFAETGSSFALGGHHALNSDLSPQTLAANQCRVKLAVTPRVTLRGEDVGAAASEVIVCSKVLVVC